MVCAVFDIGSNSIKFLIAQAEGKSVKILREESHATRLAEDLIATAELKPEAIERTLQVFAQLRKTGELFGVEKWKAVATSAVRDSKNRKDFLKRAAEILGFPVTLLTGEEEADAIFLGVRSDLTWQNRDCFVIDVGGGSAEWIQGSGPRIERRMSLPLGCVRLRERFLTDYPVEPEVLAHLRDTVREQLRPLLSEYQLGGRLLVGTGGTITASAAMWQNLKDFDAEKIHHFVMSRAGLEERLRTLSQLKIEELQHITGLPKKRADIIVPGLAIFLISMELLGAQEITASVRGLRYGVLDSLLRAAASEG